MKRITSVKNYHLVIWIVGMQLILASGCAVIPDNWAFSKQVIKSDAVSQVKTIALLDVPPPKNIVLGDQFSDTATNIFGLAGMMTVEDTEGQKVTSGGKISELVHTELKKHLVQSGINLVELQAERKNKSKMLESYEQFSQVDADAILEVAPIQVGFTFKLGEMAFSKSKQKVGPVVFYKYRLVSVDSGEVLVQSNIRYSSFTYKNPVNSVGHEIQGPSWHIFENMDAVKDDPDEAISRLTHAIDRVTQIISVMVTP